MFILTFIPQALLTGALVILGFLGLSLLTLIVLLLIGQKARDRTPEALQLFAMLPFVLYVFAWAMLAGAYNIARGLGRKTPT